ncbi:MAG: hypothetical protein MZU91_14965 [Desulfosudis oleivorans]|nr:hypothetical protein [Desulfosudis oleivorans]
MRAYDSAQVLAEAIVAAALDRLNARRSMTADTNRGHWCRGEDERAI